MSNSNKVVSAGPDQFVVYYTDTQKHFSYGYSIDQKTSDHIRNFQLFGDRFREKNYQQSHENQDFTSLQNKLYKEAMYGLNAYSFQELKKVGIRDKMEIVKINKLAQKIIHEWKQEMIKDQVDGFLKNLFPHSKTIESFNKITEGFTSSRINNPITFLDLHLSKVDIANRLISKKVLPETFFQTTVL